MWITKHSNHPHEVSSSVSSSDPFASVPIWLLPCMIDSRSVLLLNSFWLGLHRYALRTLTLSDLQWYNGHSTSWSCFSHFLTPKVCHTAALDLTVWYPFRPLIDASVSGSSYPIELAMMMLNDDRIWNTECYLAYTRCCRLGLLAAVWLKQSSTNGPGCKYRYHSPEGLVPGMHSISVTKKTIQLCVEIGIYQDRPAYWNWVAKPADVLTRKSQ